MENGGEWWVLSGERNRRVQTQDAVHCSRLGAHREDAPTRRVSDVHVCIFIKICGTLFSEVVVIEWSKILLCAEIGKLSFGEQPRVLVGAQL